AADVTGGEGEVVRAALEVGLHLHLRLVADRAQLDGDGVVLVAAGHVDLDFGAAGDVAGGQREVVDAAAEADVEFDIRLGREIAEGDGEGVVARAHVDFEFAADPGGEGREI